MYAVPKRPKWHNPNHLLWSPDNSHMWAWKKMPKKPKYKKNTVLQNCRAPDNKYTFAVRCRIFLPRNHTFTHTVLGTHLKQNFLTTIPRQGGATAREVVQVAQMQIIQVQQQHWQIKTNKWRWRLPRVIRKKGQRVSSHICQRQRWIGKLMYVIQSSPDKMDNTQKKNPPGCFQQPQNKT